MGLSIRHYIIENDTALRRVPKRVAEALPFGTDAIPEYANSRQKVADVLIENQNGKPVRILDVIGTYWEFDGEGKIDIALRRTAGEWIDCAFAKPRMKDQTVVDLVPEIRKKDLHERHRWLISKDLLDLIAADIWPGVHGPAPEITLVKGKAPKRPPVTYSAKHALSEIGLKVGEIGFEIGRLSEPDLKGFEFECMRNCEFEDAPIWRGIAEEAKNQRAVLAAYRTGKGEWYAVLEAFRQIGPNAMETVLTAHERCANRQAAAEAGKRLMTEKVEWFGADIVIEVKICSALEWQCDED